MIMKFLLHMFTILRKRHVPTVIIYQFGECCHLAWAGHEDDFVIEERNYQTSSMYGISECYLCMRDTKKGPSFEIKFCRDDRIC